MKLRNSNTLNDWAGITVSSTGTGRLIMGAVGSVAEGYLPALSRRTFSYACVAAAAVAIFYLTKEKWYPRSLNLIRETSDSNLLTGDREAASN
ncbi:MAG: hypothetical protein QXO25_06305, partial [Candidatus Bathyarchaeia archaeon]